MVTWRFYCSAGPDCCLTETLWTCCPEKTDGWRRIRLCQQIFLSPAEQPPLWCLFNYENYNYTENEVESVQCWRIRAVIRQRSWLWWEQMTMQWTLDRAKLQLDGPEVGPGQELWVQHQTDRIFYNNCEDNWPPLSICVCYSEAFLLF